MPLSYDVKNRIHAIIKDRNVEKICNFKYLIKSETNFYYYDDDSNEFVDSIDYMDSELYTVYNYNYIMNFGIYLVKKDIFKEDNIKIYSNGLNLKDKNIKFSFQTSGSIIQNILTEYFRNYEGFDENCKFRNKKVCELQIGGLSGTYNINILYTKENYHISLKIMNDGRIYIDKPEAIDSEILHHEASYISQVKKFNVDIMLVANKTNKLFYQRFKKYL